MGPTGALCILQSKARRAKGDRLPAQCKTHTHRVHEQHNGDCDKCDKIDALAWIWMHPVLIDLRWIDLAVPTLLH